MRSRGVRPAVFFVAAVLAVLAAGSLLRRRDLL